MIPLEEALERILGALEPLESEGSRLWDAAGRVAAESVLAPIDLPPFDNSAMDGYAVRAQDVASASVSNPVTLKVIARTPAGDSHQGRIQPLETVRLFTGSMLPEGADAVVMQEDTLPGETTRDIRILDSVKPFENVRFRGEDVQRTSLLIARGQELGFAQLGLLAATGTEFIRCFVRPKVAILATGSELRESGQPIQPGQIYESNRIALRARLTQAHVDAKVFPLVSDSLEATQQTLLEAFETCDAVISTGGVSVGDWDFVKQAFSAVGGRTEFWQLSLKPGKPFVFGKRKAVPFFGLPGNPVSALVTFQLLVLPAIQKLRGMLAWRQPITRGVLAKPIKNGGDRRHFVRVKIDPEGVVTTAGSQGSHILKSLSESNGLLDIPPGATLEKGSAVSVISW